MKVLIVDASITVQQRYASELQGSGVIVIPAFGIEEARRKLKKKHGIEAVVCGEMQTTHEQHVLLDIIKANQDRFPRTMISTAKIRDDIAAQVRAGCTIALEVDRVPVFLKSLASGEPIQRCCYS
jgi:DNA-binding NtrC family response regulator